MDADLIRKYEGQGPRYTSYPTADRFVQAFDGGAYRQRLANRSSGGFTRPLGLYVHVPVGETPCFYCACTKIATRDHSKARRYLGYLEAEMDLVATHLGGDLRIARMHWDGGMPTFLDEEESELLMHSIRARFDLDPHGDYAVEIDPRRVHAGRIASLARLGFNRMSLGVQDLDLAVQRSVNRVQGFDETKAAIDTARANGFRSVSLDLIHGLPKQNVAGFERTLDRVLECDPDRIALCSYAHLPAVVTPQRSVRAEDLPRLEVKLELLLTAIRRFGEAGYVYIGMDQFAKQGDELDLAQVQGRLTRDFRGYSASGECDLVGIGIAATGKIGPAYCQNVKTLPDYYGMLDRGQLPVLRGIELTPDDLVRRAVIQALACQFTVSRESIAIAHRVDFDRYFAAERRDLQRLANDGLVELDGDRIQVTPMGRLLVRAVCAVFDRYLRATEARERSLRVM